MPRLGSGQYYLPPGTTAAPDTTVESARYNIFTADIETEINQIHTDTAGVNDPVTGLPSKVAKAGDTMTGPLVLPAAAPTLATHAANKSYVDTKVAKAGDTMTGLLKISVTGDQARFQGASYGVIHRNDDANYYTLLTNAGNPDGTWNSFRPFTINLATGNVSMGQALTVSGTLNGADIYASRSANSGYCFFGTNGSHYVGFDGVSYQMPSASLQIGAPINGSSAATVTWTDANYMPRAGGTFTGAVTVNGTITATGQIATPNYVYFGAQGSSKLVGWDGGNLVFYGGNVYFNGNLNQVGAVYSSEAFRTSFSQGVFVNGASNGNPWISELGSMNPNWGTIHVQGLHYPGVWAGLNMDCGGVASFSFRNDGSAYKSGGTWNWDGYSDARIKDVKGDYSSGLDAVVALRPVRFVYKGNDTYAPPSAYSDSVIDQPETKEVPQVPYVNSPNYQSALGQKEYIGLLAQEAEVTMPELFFQTKAYIDGEPVDDFRNVNYSALTFALVNAIKELKAEVDELKARLP